MHRSRIAAAVLAGLALAAACTDSHSTPLPRSKGGELVVLAGGDTPFRGGSLRGYGRPISSTGALTTGPDGSVYFGVNTVGRDSGNARLVRLAPDGKMTPLAPDLTHFFYSLQLRDGMLWQLGAGRPVDANLSQIPVTAATPGYFTADDPSSFSLIRDSNAADALDVMLLDGTGRPATAATANRVTAAWDQRGLVFDGAGRPQVVLADGTVYRITPPTRRGGPSTAQPVEIRGLAAALQQLPGSAQVLATVQNSAGWTAITTTGLVAVPTGDAASSTPYDPSLTLPRLYSATVLPDDTILATTYRPDQVEAIYPNGRTRVVTVPITRNCSGGDQRGRLASPYGIAFRVPDQVVISSWGCNRLYAVNQKKFAG